MSVPMQRRFLAKSSTSWGVGRMAYMSKITARLVAILFGFAAIASACGSDAPASSQAASASPGSSSEAEVPVGTQTDTTIASDPTTTTSLVEALAFQEEEASTEHQIWDDVESVSVDWTIEFEAGDPPLNVTGGFTAGEGLTVRWEDLVEGDILAMFTGDQVFRAFRVGNEVFIAEDPGTEDAFGPLFVGELAYEAVGPLETGELPDAASTFVEVEGVRSELPDIFYDLPPDATEGQIVLGEQWLLDVAKDEPGTRYGIPDAEVTLTREEVGGFDNPVLRQWYLDQAG